MSLNLEEKFRTYCNTQNLELNPNQIVLVKQLDNFYKENFKSALLNFFFQTILKKRFLSLWWCWCWKNYDFRFFFLI